MINCGNSVEEELDEIQEELSDDAALQEEIAEEELGSTYIKMDFSLENPKDRVKKVEEIIANTPSEKLTQKYLEKLSDYIIFAMDKQERKKKNIITDNRKVTVNKRETSFEGLISKFENGEDGIYSMIANDKNIIFQHKLKISEDDINVIPGMKELVQAIAEVEEAAKHARGKRAFQLRKQLIEMRQDQYVLRAGYKKTMYSQNLIKSMHKADLSEKITIDEEGHVHSTGLINFYDEKCVSAILCNFKKLYADSWDKCNSDIKWMLYDFSELVWRAIDTKYPIYSDIITYKMNNVQNAEIQQYIYEDYGVRHSVEYISSLWRNKIPKLIAETAENEYLEWYYTFVEKGKWKKCSRCGQIKLAHNNFFSKNKTSKDGYYSICKVCRNKKMKESDLGAK